MKGTWTFRLRVAALLIAVALPATTSPVGAQTIPLRKQLLLKTKAALLKSVATYDQHISESTALAKQAQQMRDSAQSTGDNRTAQTAALALNNANLAIERARRFRADAQARIAAIDAALAWPESEQTSAVPLLVRGNVFVYRRGADLFRLADRTVPLRSGDRVEIPAGAYVELQFPDGTRTSLDPETTFVYREEDHVPVYELLKGKLRSIEDCARDLRGCIDMGRFRVRTPRTVVAVRGTEFTIETGDQGTTYTVLDGSIAVRVGDSAADIVVSKGQRLRLAADAAGGVPEPVTDTVSKWWEP